MIDTKELREKIITKGLDVVADTDVLELINRLEAAEKERDALRAKIREMERQKPAGTLHDDGCFVWRETAPHQSNYAGWKMALYAGPGAKGEAK